MNDDSVSIDDLTLDASNARLRGDRANKQLTKSLEQFGAARSVVIDADGIVRAGNGTVTAAKAAGITRARIVPASRDELIVVQRDDLEGEEAKAYAIADNRTAELAEWDLDELGDQLEALTQFEPSDLGFDDTDLSKLFPDVSPVGPDEQGLLDQETTHTCPNCGHEFA